MRAMRLGAQASIERHPLRLDEIPVPEPAPREVLVSVSVCGLCRTDLHVVEGDLPLRRVPVVPGHQVVGRVVRVGAHASRFRPGDRVGIAWLRRTCGRCRFCRGERENLCEEPEFTGWTADGGFADYAVVPEAFAYAIPEPFDDAQAAPLLCAGIIGYRALRRSAVAPGGRLAIYGFGSSAHVTIQVAVARGIEVYVATREPARRAHARALGARWVGEIGERMPHPADGAIVFAPAGEIVTAALANLERGGTLALAGIYMTPIPSLPYPAVFDERVITTVTANTRQDGEELLAEAARIPVRPVVTPFPLAEANQGLELVKRGAVEGTGILVIDGARQV
jgi:propanol-preferring alcohol dehydrogenase